MKKRKLIYENNYPHQERPYYVLNDNSSSRMRINRISNFDSLNEVVQDKRLTKALIVDNYFDNEYMKKIKKEVLSYPTNNE
ncbi:MAG: hypothetical protein IJ966_04595 [Bacilli bacterium]|nr:hypothetical protein [Bacilli bacterium]